MDKSGAIVKSFKNSAPEIERMVSDEGLKIKHGEIDMHVSKKLSCAVEEKTSEAEEVKNSFTLLCL